MAYTVTKLINEAWFLSGKVSRKLQTVTGDDLNHGFLMLNALLAFKTVDYSRIPYFTTQNFTGVVGQESYTISNLIEIETLTFDYAGVTYVVASTTRKEYFGTPRVIAINSLPIIYFMERAKGGGVISMYYRPDKTYEFEIRGKFQLEQLTSYEEDLSLVLDPFYIEYLRYALAEYMCQETDLTFQPQKAKKLAEMEALIQEVSLPDYSMTKSSTLQRDGSGYKWADVNLGKGWRPV
jgi:hypothetical protein